MKLKMITVAMLLAVGMNLVARDLAQMKNYRELSNLVYANLPANEQEQLLRLAVTSGLPAQSSAARSAIGKHFKGINWNQITNIYNNQGFNGVKAHLGITAPAPASPTTPSKSGPIILTTPTTIPTPPPFPPRPQTQPQAQQGMSEAQQKKIMQKFNQEIERLNKLIQQHWNDMSQLERVNDPLTELSRAIDDKEQAGLSNNNATQLRKQASELSRKITDRVFELDKEKQDAIKAFEQRFRSLHLRTHGLLKETKHQDLEADMQALESIITDINNSKVLDAQNKKDLVTRANKDKADITTFIKARVPQELQSLTTQLNDALSKAANIHYLQYLLDEIDGKLDMLGQMKQEYISQADKVLLQQEYTALLGKVKDKIKELQGEQGKDMVKSNDIRDIVDRDDQAAALVPERARRWKRVQEEMTFWEDAVADRIAENSSADQLNRLKTMLNKWDTEFKRDTSTTRPNDIVKYLSEFTQRVKALEGKIDDAIKKIKV